MTPETTTSLLSFVQKHVEQDPVSVAHMLETMEEASVLPILKVLDPEYCAQIFPHLQVSYAAALFKEVTAEHFVEIAKEMKPEQAAAILIHLAHDLRKVLVERLPLEMKREVQELLRYPEDSAGRIMTTEYLAFRKDTKVKDAIQRIRSLAVQQHAPQTYAYVMDEGKHLMGVLNMRDLLLASPEAPLESIMKTDVFSVSGFMDREEVAHELAKRHFFTAPVVDAEHRLLGVLKADSLIGEIQDEATEDILKMVGAGSDEETFSPILFSLKKRLPWLHVNLATAFLAASVVALFEDIIARITILAVFLPVVAGQGGNAGAQTLAVVMRGLVMREIRPTNARRIILKEAGIGVLNGVIIGVVTAAIAWIWHGNPFLGVVIGLGMIVNLTAAGLSGAAIPILLKRFGLDPAQSSSIFLTTITDVVGFFAFLGFAVLFQDFLV